MNIYERPNKTKVIELLSICNLPSSDIEDNHLDTFLGCGDENNIEGIVGLEVHDSYGLLRSLAVSPEARKLGYGEALVSRIEDLAKSKGLIGIFLLTETAEEYFSKRGYRQIDRESVPRPIKNTTEFSSICPDNASVMVKYI